MHQLSYKTAGLNLSGAAKALVMIHGRGASAADILSLSSYLNVKDYCLVAPQATNHTWYPYSFMAPRQENEPWLSSALDGLANLVREIEKSGIPSSQIWLLGFSQGACLTLEFAARHPRRWGGVIAFTGGLIGDVIQAQDYTGDLEKTPIFIGSSDPDPHVPPHRVHQSAQILKGMNADVTETIYPNMGHTISEDELREANRVLRGGDDR